MPEPMNSLSFAHLHGIAGRYCAAGGEWSVTLRRCGESYEIVSLTAERDAALAVADDAESVTTEFTVPRAGADRYPDWAAFEWNVRFGESKGFRKDVWRIAEDRTSATFLGLAVPETMRQACFPLAAALWRGWRGVRSGAYRALFWNSDHCGHLWLARPFAPPTYVRVGPHPTPEEVVCAVTLLDQPPRVVLEVGGVSLDYWRELTRAYPGRTCQAEPFGDYLTQPRLREQILSAADPTLYLPALGAARALADGAPPVISLCESSPEHSADGV